MRDFLSLSKKNLLEVFISAPTFLQFLYAVRNLWWGIGIYLFSMTFFLEHLQYLTKPIFSIGLFLSGVSGIFGIMQNNHKLNYFFAILNVFILANISISYFIFLPKSVGGINYFIEMLGAVWLSYRLQRDKAKNIRYKSYLHLEN